MLEMRCADLSKSYRCSRTRRISVTCIMRARRNVMLTSKRMSQTVEPSAYAVYTAKRKLNMEQVHGTYKKKKKSLLQNISAVDLNHIPNRSAKLKSKKKKAKSKTSLNIDKRKVQIMKSKKKNRKKNPEKYNATSNNNTCGKEELNYNSVIPENNDRLDDDGLCENPVEIAIKVFEWLIYPVPPIDFFKKRSSVEVKQHWERRPLNIKRNSSSYYEILLSTRMLDTVLRENEVLFTKNIDITTYTNGVRETFNPPGRALPNVVWDYYRNGCSVRMLNPQTYIHEIYTLCAILQEFFNCFVGCNVYLTPPNSQGFAPHYDDIEAFILQIEGKKRWRLYKPPNKDSYLARYSSRDFKQSEIGEPILDTVVQPGDLLYFPRGTIHQAETIGDSHSLHITLSVYQKNSWCDLFEKLLPQALEQATKTDKCFREGLPLHYLKYFGIVHNENINEDIRNAFKEKVKTLFTRLIDYIDIDSIADMMAKDHIHDFLPPTLNNIEEEHSVIKDGLIMVGNGIIESNNGVGIEISTRIRLLRSHCIRLMKEDGIYKIYFSTENSKVYHEHDPQFLEVDGIFVPAIREIITQYPKFILVGDLPISKYQHKIQIATDLWERGLVITGGSYIPEHTSE